MKLIIADRRMPEEAAQKLQTLGKVMWFETTGITYPSISGHPDIFFTVAGGLLIVAPNTPEDYLKALKNSNINFILGRKPVGALYPDTAAYNILTDATIALHNFKHTDQIVETKTKHLEKIHVNQGYCRCNCLSLDSLAYICSDRGMESALKNAGKEVLYVRSDSVLLEGMSHGFLPGAMGVNGREILFCGDLSYLPEKEQLLEFTHRFDFQINELYEGPPVDVGGILCIHE
jgi:hypothetical protein